MTVWICAVGAVKLESCTEETGELAAVDWLAIDCVEGSLLSVNIAGELNAVGWFVDGVLLLVTTADWLDDTLPIIEAEGELVGVEPLGKAESTMMVRI